MPSIPAKLRKLLDATSQWKGCDRLTFKPNWSPFEKSTLKSLAPVAGVYAIGLTRSLRYEAGDSFVIYVGSSKNLSNRLATHHSSPLNEIIRLCSNEFEKRFQVATWPFEGLSGKWLRSIEGELLWAFESRFGTVPIANLDIPETVFGAGRFGLAKADLQAAGPSSLGLRELARRFGREWRIEELHPIGNPKEVSITFSFDEVGKLSTPGKYRAVRFLDPAVVDRQRKQELEHLAWVTEEYVGAWSVEKFQQLICLSKQLQPVKSRAKTVLKFAANSRDVPTPHTWGEVALVKARIESGGWLAKGGRVWIKIVHDKELLGEAKQFDYMFEGLDRSDLPQRSTMRKSYWQDYDPPSPHSYRKEEMVEVERLESKDEYTGEEFLQIRSELTPQAVDRLAAEDKEYHRREQKKLEDTIESTFLKAWQAFA